MLNFIAFVKSRVALLEVANFPDTTTRRTSNLYIKSTSTLPRYGEKNPKVALVTSFQIRAFVLSKITNDLPSRQLLADVKHKYSHFGFS